MESYVLRVWLPDRPGALGAVASRIGAVKGDVVGIEILETGAGQAVDELVVKLPDATLVDLLVSEVRQVDGVHLEEVRSLGSAGHDPRRAMLEAVASLVGATDRDQLLAVTRDELCRSLSASWLAVVDLDGRRVLVAGDGAPGESWLVAFAHGSISAQELQGDEAPGVGQGHDVASAALPELGLALVAGRDGIAWRERERDELRALAQIMAVRWSELVPTP